MMVERGADVIAFASCVSRGNPIGFPCPHFEAMRGAVAKALPDNITIIDYTH